MKTVFFVTGATGHLGMNLIHLLVSQGYPVRALVLPHDRLRQYLPAVVDVVEGSVTSRQDIDRFLSATKETHRVIIHCAGIVSIRWAYDARVDAVNVGGTRHLLEACRGIDNLRFIYVSSVHAIPELAYPQVIHEIDHFDPTKIVGSYGKTKAIATQLVLDAVRNDGLNASIVFPSGIIGPFDYGKGHTTQTLIDACCRRLPMSITGGYDFVDARDVAQGILSCVHHGKPGKGYLLTNTSIHVSDLLQLVHQQTGVRVPRVQLPLFFAYLALPVLGLYYKVMKRVPTFTRYSLYTMRSNSLFDHSLATQVLDYHPRPLTATIRDTLHWLSHQQFIPLIQRQIVTKTTN